MTHNLKTTTNLTINTIPLPKLTTILNEFIVKTVNHLNKLSVHVEEKLGTFDTRLREIDIMVTLLESKLNSLPPQITSKYPSLVHYSINDINPEIVTNKPIEKINEKVENNVQNNVQKVENVENNNNTNTNNTEQNNAENEATEKVEENISPELKNLNNLLEENPSLQNFYINLKNGIPEQAIIQRAVMSGFKDMDLIKNLVLLYKLANPKPNEDINN